MTLMAGAGQTALRLTPGYTRQPGSPGDTTVRFQRANGRVLEGRSTDDRLVGLPLYAVGANTAFVARRDRDGTYSVSSVLDAATMRGLARGRRGRVNANKEAALQRDDLARKLASAEPGWERFILNRTSGNKAAAPVGARPFRFRKGNRYMNVREMTPRGGGSVTAMGFTAYAMYRKKKGERGLGNPRRSFVAVRRDRDGTYSIAKITWDDVMDMHRLGGGWQSNRQRRDTATTNTLVPLYTMFETEKLTDVRGEKRNVLRYGMFNKNGKVYRNPYSPYERTTNEKMADIAPPEEPPLCVGEKLDLRDQGSCFVQGMRARLAKELQDAQTPGYDGCGGKTARIQPHQRAVLNLARTMAARSKKPEDLNGFRGLLVWHNTGSGKCISRDCLVVLWSGETITAGELQPGMSVLGMDGTPRRVLDVGRGVEPMYDIVPTKGETWRCNASHVLSLRYNRQGRVTRTREGYSCVHWHEDHGDRGAFRTKTFVDAAEAEAFAATIPKDHVVDIPLEDYLRLPIYMRHYLKLFRTGRVSFAPRDAPTIDPYALGAWLGDGHANSTELTLGDAEIAAEIARRTGLPVEPRPSTVGKSAPTYRIKCAEGESSNAFMAALRKYDLLGNKHVPADVKCGSVDTRLAVLAGLLDTDGYLGGGCYEITQKSEQLSRDVAFVARSLGFAAYVKRVQKTCVTGEKRVQGTYHKVSISGAGLDDLPMVVARKRAAPRQQTKDALRTGFDVRPAGLGEYAGPVLDGDKRYVLGDFTVTHNTVTALGIALAFWDTKRRIVLSTTPDNKKDNNLNKYAVNLFALYPEYVSKVFKNPATPYPPPPWTVNSQALKDWCNKAENIKPLTNRIQARTFTELASTLCAPKTGSSGRADPEGPMFLQGAGAPGCPGRAAKKPEERFSDGSVLIMDEVQSLFTPAPQYATAAKFLVEQLSREEYRKKTFIFAMTATPGNNVGDIVKVLNFVRPLNGPVFSDADAKDPSKFGGLVSYVDIRGDQSRYGVKTVKNIFVEMSPRYYAAFLKTIKLADADLDYRRMEKADKAISFLLKQRAAGNYLPRTAVTGLYSDEELKKLASVRPVPGVVSMGGRGAASVRVLSDKLLAALENVLTMPGKQYLWVAELNTAKLVMRVFETLGYSQVLPGKEKSVTGAGKRFILYKSGQANGIKMEETALKKLAEAYNDTNNADGGRIKIMLGTETYYQGLDMKALQGVHLVDALFNATADKQAVGRALRLCGHAGAPSKKVVVYRYFSTVPAKFDPEAVQPAKGRKIDVSRMHKKVRALPAPEAFKGVILPEGHNASRPVPSGINSYVYAEAVRRQQPVEAFELGLKAFAVDCPLFKTAYHRGEPYQCGVKPNVSAMATAAAAATGSRPTGATGAPKPPVGFLAGLVGGRRGNGKKPMPGTIAAGPVKNKPKSPSTPTGKNKPSSKNNRNKPSAPPMPPNMRAEFNRKYPTKTVKKGQKPTLEQLRAKNAKYPTKTAKKPTAAPQPKRNNRGRNVVLDPRVFFGLSQSSSSARAPAPAAPRKAPARPNNARRAPNAGRSQLLRNANAAAERLRIQRRKQIEQQRKKEQLEKQLRMLQRQQQQQRR